jgi:hypothetical protein
MNKKKNEKEMISLNEGLYNDFFVLELEQRLETDPLMVGGILEWGQEADLLAADCFTFNCEFCNPIF